MISNMGYGLLLFMSFVLFTLNVGNGFPSDLITELPGQPKVTFRQFAGYIDADEHAGRSLFYYFVEAELDSLNRPLTIWLAGGPGCSSVGDAFSSTGPFITATNGRGLQANKCSWNKVTNMLFIDSPIGSGWSYSNTSNDYDNGDASTTQNLITFLLKWYEKYPDFKSRDLYLAGSSYGGHFVPNLANALLDHNKQSKDEFKFNIKGIALGNPLLRRKLDILTRFDFFFSRGMINEKLHKDILNECNSTNEDNYPTTIGTNLTEPCINLTSKATLIAFRTDDPAVAEGKLFDLLRDQCEGTMEDLQAGKEVSKISYEVDMCTPLRGDFYFNLPEVQQAFHGNRSSLPYPWKGCFMPNFKYNETDKDADMLLTLRSLIQQSIRITVFSGDQDGRVPTMGTLKHLTKLSEELNLTITKDESWNFENKEAGWMYSFGDLLTFMTVKGGNHHVTFSRPPQALFIFSNFISNKSAIQSTFHVNAQNNGVLFDEPPIAVTVAVIIAVATVIAEVVKML